MSRYISKQMITTPLPLTPGNSRVKVKAGDNWAIVGRKGSGKTTFGKWLVSAGLVRLYNTMRIYVLDIKMRDFNNWPGIVRTSGEVPPRPDDNQRVQVWQPISEIPEEIEKWLWNVWHDAPAILKIDELSALKYGARDTSEEYNKILKLGRALPITTIAHTQELVDIPRNLIGQSDHIVRFRLKHPYEKRIIQNLMEVDKLDEPIDKYGFHYLQTEGSEPEYFKNTQEFFGLRQ